MLELNPGYFKNYSWQKEYLVIIRLTSNTGRQQRGGGREKNPHASLQVLLESRKANGKSA